MHDAAFAQRSADRSAHQLEPEERQGAPVSKQIAHTRTPQSDLHHLGRLVGNRGTQRLMGSEVHPLLTQGDALPPLIRADAEARFGQDFRKVKIHAGPEADLVARSLNALAFTLGNHIVFSAEAYALGTPKGRRVLAHELVHVVQQSGPGLSPASIRTLHNEPSAAAEQEATMTSTKFGQGESVRPSIRLHAHTVQKWDSLEHVALGDFDGGALTGLTKLDSHDRDFPDRHKPQESWPEQWRARWKKATPAARRAMTEGLTYGGIIALSGDFYASFSDMSTAPLIEIIDLIPLIHRKSGTSELQTATAGRYLLLAEKNISHFTNAPSTRNNLAFWRTTHMQAIEKARTGQAALAWGLNATADHYLTDAFSGGHIRVPRETLAASGTKGNIESKVLHDLDNAHGVLVTNERGDPPWLAYGDDMLMDKRNFRNRELAQEAVQASKRDITEALLKGESYPLPTGATIFAAQKLIPRAADATRNRWGWWDYSSTLTGLVRDELPGMAAQHLIDDDDQVRAWVNGKELREIGTVPVEEKIRMIVVLIGGVSVITDDDMHVIEKILGSVATEHEMSTLRRLLLPRALDFTSIGDRTRFRLALDRRP